MSLSNLKYYRAFSEKYRQLKSKYSLCEDWSTMQGFKDTMYATYVDARECGDKIQFITTSESTPTPADSYWKPIKGSGTGRNGRGTIHYTADYSIDLSQDRYHLKMLADRVKKPSSRVRKKLKELQVHPDFGEVTTGKVKIYGETMTYHVTTELLTKYQFELLEAVLTVTSNKGVSDYIYIMKAADKIKIGITKDVEKRRKSLYYSSPCEVEILYSTRVPNTRKVEKELHSKYDVERSHGEWFNLTEDQVQDTINYLKGLDTVK